MYIAFPMARFANLDNLMRTAKINYTKYCTYKLKHDKSMKHSLLIDHYL